METSNCEDTEDESILEVSEFDWATYLGVIQYLRRQKYWPFLTAYLPQCRQSLP